MKTSTRRSQLPSRALERFVVWANSSILKDRDLTFEYEDGMALNSEECESSSYREAQASLYEAQVQALINKLALQQAAIERKMQ